MEQQFSPMIIFQESLGSSHTSITSLILSAPLCRTSHYLHGISRKVILLSQNCGRTCREGRRVVALNGTGVSYWTQSPESSSPLFFFFGHWVLTLLTSVRCRGRGAGRAWCWSGMQLLIVVASLGEHRRRCVSFSSCSTHTQKLWHTHLAAPQCVRSSQSRGQTCVPGTGRQILMHCTTREVHSSALLLAPKVLLWSTQCELGSQSFLCFSGHKQTK